MTKVLGFRADPANARYAIVSCDGTDSTLENAASESKLVYPADIDTVPQKLEWLHREFERMFHANRDIEMVVIKTNEYGLNEKAAMRESSYLEAVLLLFCQRNGIPVEIKTYNSLGTRSKDAKTHAEHRVGRTSKYWDAKMADAVIAAWWGAKNK
ncbi:MAG: hypothetical protein K0U74_04700 [Alphaproteobacteria bacterium]|nr:hypothetical protein [Alphaproteobacteria bacterium]